MKENSAMYRAGGFMVNYSFSLVIYLSVLFFSTGVNADLFDSNGVKIFFTDSKGTADPIVLIHGHTMSSDMWYEAGIATKLTEKYRVIALDCRGHGKSGKPESPTEYGPKVGKDIVNLLDHLEIDKAHMVGYSMGAFVIGRLLVSNPDRIHTAILASGFFPTSDKDEQRYQESIAIDMEQHGEHAFAAVARGWRYDAVTDLQISKITVPVKAVFGSEEINEFFDSQKVRLRMPKLALPIVIIEGADHGTSKAAVLHPKFLETVENFIGINSGVR